MFDADLVIVIVELTAFSFCSSSSTTLPILSFPPSPIDDDDSVVAVCCDHHPIDEIPSCSHGNDGSSII